MLESAGGCRLLSIITLQFPDNTLVEAVQQPTACQSRKNNVKDGKLVEQESGTKAQHKELKVQEPKLSFNTVRWGSVNAVQQLKTQAPTPLQKGDFETQARQDSEKVVHLQDESRQLCPRETAQRPLLRPRPSGYGPKRAKAQKCQPKENHRRVDTLNKEDKALGEKFLNSDGTLK